MAQAIAEAAQHVVQRHRRETAGHRAQVAHGGLNQRIIDLHPVQHRFGIPQGDSAQQAYSQRQPQGLAHQRTDLAVVAGTKALRHLGCGGQQHAGHQQEHRYPQRVAQCDRGQIARADAASHHGIDKAHGGMRQLGNDDRDGEGEQGAQFGADVLQAGGKGGHAAST